MNTIKKKMLLLATMLWITTSVVFGQKDSNQVYSNNNQPVGYSNQAFGKGTNLINVGVGLGGYYTYWGSGYYETPNFMIDYENGTFGNVGPGTISLGGLLSYKAISDNWIGGDGYNYNQMWRYWVLGFRGAYHLIVPGAPRFDPYAGLMLGYYFLDYSFTTNNPDYRTPGNPGYVYYTATYPDYFYPSLFVGARYKLSSAVALWGELGYGYSALTLGASFKL